MATHALQWAAHHAAVIIIEVHSLEFSDNSNNNNHNSNKIVEFYVFTFFFFNEPHLMP